MQKFKIQELLGAREKLWLWQEQRLVGSLGALRREVFEKGGSERALDILERD